MPCQMASIALLFCSRIATVASPSISRAGREAAGLPVTDLLTVTTPGDAANPPIKGAKHWPEATLPDLHEHRVELAGKSGKKHIAALVHKTSGHRLERGGD
jgi:uncharacterized protein (DUF58 family)